MVLQESEQPSSIPERQSSPSYILQNKWGKFEWTHDKIIITRRRDNFRHEYGLWLWVITIDDVPCYIRHWFALPNITNQSSIPAFRVYDLRDKVPCRLAEKHIKVRSSEIPADCRVEFQTNTIESVWKECPYDNNIHWPDMEDAFDDLSEEGIKHRISRSVFAKLVGTNYTIMPSDGETMQEIIASILIRKMAEYSDIYNKITLLFFAQRQVPNYRNADTSWLLLKEAEPIIFTQLQDVIRTQQGEELIENIILLLRQIDPKNRAKWCLLFSQTSFCEELKAKIRQSVPFTHAKLSELEQKRNHFWTGSQLDLVGPHIVSMELNYWCSLNCGFCWVHAPKLDKWHQFSASDVMRLHALYKDFDPIFYRASDPLDYSATYGWTTVNYFDIHSLSMLMGHAPFVSTAIPVGSEEIIRQNHPLLSRVSRTYKNLWRQWKIPQDWFGSAYEHLPHSVVGIKDIVINWTWNEARIPANMRTKAILDDSTPCCQNGVLLRADWSLWNEVNLNRIIPGQTEGSLLFPINFEQPRYLNNPSLDRSDIQTSIDPKGVAILTSLMSWCIVMHDHVGWAAFHRVSRYFRYEKAVPLRIMHFDWHKRNYVYSPDTEVSEGIFREFFVAFSEEKFKKEFLY